jgi:glutamate racemase
VPYGTKSLATVERYAVENAKFLEAHGIKMLVVACNTASALALPAIRRSVNVEVVGVIEPGARAAVAAAPGNRIGVIATEATVNSHAYNRAITAIDESAQVIERACPLFVSLAEEGWAETAVARDVARQYLIDINAETISALVLGCTTINSSRRNERRWAVTLIDSGAATAREVKTLLKSRACT